jgi:hypothetical protein
MVMKEQIANDLTGVLGAKKELLQRMLNSIRRSIDLLAGDSIDDFNNEMDKCQEYMHEIDKINVTITSMQPPDIEKPYAVLQLENQIVYVLRQIADANMECNSAAKEKLKSFGYSIKALRQKRQGIDIYTYQFGRNAAFVDVKL